MTGQASAVRLRGRRRDPVLDLVLSLFFLVPAMIIVWAPWGGEVPGRGWLLAVVIVSSASALAALTADLRAGVTLTPEHMVVHNLRRRVLAWPQVQDIQVRDRLGGGLSIALVVDGRKLALREPRTTTWGGGSSVRAAAAEIDVWWRQYRGPGWKPTNPSGRPAVTGRPTAT